MASFDQVRIDPTPEDLAAALAEASASFRRGGTPVRVNWPPTTLTAELAEVGAAPEGYRSWDIGGQQIVKTVCLAWWTDALKRRHVRVGAGKLDHFRRGDPLLFNKSIWWTPLALVYPARTLVRGGPRPTSRVVCACGAAGRPEEVAWVGERCGVCHDRLLDGQSPTASGPEGCVLRHRSGKGTIRHLSWSHDGSMLVSCHIFEVTHVVVWDARTLRRRHTWQAGPNNTY
jgi:hypothetical protein